MKIRNTVILFLLASLVLIACVQKTYERKVNFSVDMRTVENIDSVSIRGNFQPLSWQRNYRMHDLDQDSIFSVTISFDTPFDYLEVKFVKNESDFELLDEGNRRVYFTKDGTSNFSAVFNDPSN